MAVSELTIKSTLGALVHDLGKLDAQVPGRPPSWTRFDCETPGQHHSFESCPTCPRRFRYAHAPLSANLLREVGAPGWLQQLALTHHGQEAAGDPIVEIVRKGDALAAGERDAPGAGERSREPLLYNVFAVDRAASMPPLPLTVAWFERQHFEQDTAFTALSQSMRDSLRLALQFAGDNLEAMADHLLGAVQRSATFFPSAFYRDIADVSLASHLQLAAALAGAIAAAGVAQTGAAVATLIIGDVSGIQQFIHRVASKRAARALRARSFYVQLFAELASRFLVRELGVTPANVISSMGGRFMLIAPANAADQIEELRTRLDRLAHDLHGVSLTVNLGAAPLTSVADQDFSTAVAEALASIAEVKWRRFERSAAALGLFAARGSGGPTQACRSCGGDAPDGIADEEGERLCFSCSSLEELGRQLTTSRYLLIEPGDAGPTSVGGAVDLLASAFGFRLTLSSEPPSPPFAGSILALDEAALEDLSCARLFPVGRHVPMLAGRRLDFEEIASRASGRPILAVAKVDVDDLGVLLRKHFAPPSGRTDSPSRFATFSRMLSLFFEGYVHHLAASEYPDLYLVFSGGDDLLAVGPWDKVLAFLERIRRDFSTWTAVNPAFHFSAGIALGDRSRPIILALQEAEAALAKAKEQPGKQSVCLMGHALRWEAFDAVGRWRDRLTDLVLSGGASGPTARGLLQHLEGLEQYDQQGKVVYGPHVWRTHYYLKRFIERHAVADTGLLDEVGNELLRVGGPTRLALAARLAEFATWEKD